MSNLIILISILSLVLIIANFLATNDCRKSYEILKNILKNSTRYEHFVNNAQNKNEAFLSFLNSDTFNVNNYLNFVSKEQIISDSLSNKNIAKDNFIGFKILSIILAFICVTAIVGILGVIFFKIGFSFVALFSAIAISIIVLGNKLKMKVLNEPLVWTDLLLFKEAFSHPGLYFSYASTKSLIAFILLISSLIVGAVLTINICTWQDVSFYQVLVMAICSLGILIIPFFLPSSWLIKILQKLNFNLSHIALYDATAFTPLFSFYIQLLELKATKDIVYKKCQNSFKQNNEVMLDSENTISNNTLDNVLLVQAESYCSLNKLLNESNYEFEKLNQKYGSNYDLDIAWDGAYTMRTEFEVLSGICIHDLGIFAYNPYLLVQKFKFNSIAKILKQKGFYTVCIHPNSELFFGRDKVMKNFGFDEFVALKDMPNLERNGPHVSDVALLNFTKDYLNKLKANHQKVFVFVISMEAHGPWHKGRLPNKELNDALMIYKEHLQSLSNAITSIVTTPNLFDRVVVYGDHLPSITDIKNAGFAKFDISPLVLTFENIDAIKSDMKAEVFENNSEVQNSNENNISNLKIKAQDVKDLVIKSL